MSHFKFKRIEQSILLGTYKDLKINNEELIIVRMLKFKH